MKVSGLLARTVRYGSTLIIVLTLVLGSVGLNPQEAHAVTCGFGTDIGGGVCRGFITSGTTFTTPSDYSDSTATWEAIGAGGNGATSASSNGGGGGGGGEYRKISAPGLSASTVYSINIAAGGAGTTTSGTYLKNGSNTIILEAKNGSNTVTPAGGTGGMGGTGAGGNFSGGAGGSGGLSIGGGGGGGSAGPTGAGKSGGTSTTRPGSGGGGANGGSSSVGTGSSASNNGANGGNGTSGSGQGTGSTVSTNPGTAGTVGGGGGGGYGQSSSSATAGSTAGGAGGSDTAFDASHGAGGGGAGGGSTTAGSGPGGNGGSGGTYGGGGGGGGRNRSSGAVGTGGSGGQGLIVLTYTPVTVAADLKVTADISDNTAIATIAHTYNATIKNFGSGSTGSSFTNVLQIYDNANHSYATTTTTSATLDAGNSAVIGFTYTFPATGTFQFRVCTDENEVMVGSIIESDEGNNCGNWTLIYVGNPYPDLRIPVNGDATTTGAVRVGVSTTFTATTTNDNATGPAANSNFLNILQIDNDANHNTSYATTTASLTHATSSPFALNASDSIHFSYTFPSTGTYSVRACTDENASMIGTIAESNEGNNCGNWVPVTVTALNINLSAGDVSPSSACISLPTTFSATVTNSGTDATGSGFTTLFQSATDATGTGQADVGTYTTAGLAASNTLIATLSHTFASSGIVYLRACADMQSAGDLGSITETDEANNCGSWTLVDIFYPPPTASLFANASTTTTVLENVGTASLTWDSTGATSCTGTGFATGGATTNAGGVTVGPYATTGQNPYQIDCVSGDGQHALAGALVNVVQPAASMTASPPIVSPSGSSTVNVACTGATHGTVYDSSDAIIYEADADGSNNFNRSFTVNGIAKATTYRVECTNELDPTGDPLEASVTIKLRTIFSPY